MLTDVSFAVSVKADSFQTSEKESDKSDFKAAQPDEIPEDTRGSQDTQDIDLAGATTINSTLSGNYYSSPTPGKSSYFNIGDNVKAGDTVCIVEAMKLINEINASVDCKISKFLVKDGESVEKGQPLIIVEEL